MRVAVVFATLCAILIAMGFLLRGYERAYAVLGVIAAITLVFQYYKERSLLRGSQVAIAVITEHTVRWRGAPHLWHGAPRIKYSFPASDFNTYEGEAGWNVQGLHEGTQIPVLYKTAKPGINLPLRSFVYYSSK